MFDNTNENDCDSKWPQEGGRGVVGFNASHSVNIRNIFQ